MDSDDPGNNRSRWMQQHTPESKEENEEKSSMPEEWEGTVERQCHSAASIGGA
jgi:hypothetical protein